MVDTFLDMAADSLVPVLSGTHSTDLFQHQYLVRCTQEL